MDSQLTFLDELADQPARKPVSSSDIPGISKYEGAIVFSAVGDALGWPTEFLKRNAKRKPSFELPIRDFVAWKKRIGGKWWGYTEDIAAGDYSDDTQLALAVARSISMSGDFEPERFAYEEFPLWLHYERGGGRSIKTAARKLIQGKRDWWRNTYRQRNVDYHNAGANGAAMRNLPLALIHYDDEKALVRDSFFNAIITHGHPRAILGAILLGLGVRHVLVTGNGDARRTLLDYLQDRIGVVGQLLAGEPLINEWALNWDRTQTSGREDFRTSFQSVREEILGFLRTIPEFEQKSADEYYHFVGALRPETKGSGVGTVCAALYLYITQGYEPEEAIYTAANLLGSDTDTIAGFLGGLLGADHGLDAVPEHLRDNIQDRDYLLRTARRLHNISTGSYGEQLAIEKPVERRGAYLRILAWEIGLHEMFWDALEEGATVVHPTLGRGKIMGKKIREIPREGYVAKLIDVDFDCGQTCVFHSRVKDDLEVAESLARDIEKALRE